MKNLIALRKADKEKLQEDLRRERAERMVIVKRLQKLFPSDLSFTEIPAVPDVP